MLPSGYSALKEYLLDDYTMSGALVVALVLSLMGCVTLRKSFDFSEPWLPCVQNVGLKHEWNLWE